jgi:hypothetical protein
LAMRGRGNNGFVARDTADANIQEAPEYQTNHEQRVFQESIQVGFRDPCKI